MGTKVILLLLHISFVLLISSSCIVLAHDNILSTTNNIAQPPHTSLSPVPSPKPPHKHKNHHHKHPLTPAPSPLPPPKAPSHPTPPPPPKVPTHPSPPPPPKAPTHPSPPPPKAPTFPSPPSPPKAPTHPSPPPPKAPTHPSPPPPPKAPTHPSPPPPKTPTHPSPPPPKAPTHPSPPPPKAPTHPSPPPPKAQTPPPPKVSKKPIAVRGLVFCKYCKYRGVDNLYKSTPIKGAVVKLACNNTKYHLSETTTTDKNGFFLFYMPKIVSSAGYNKCKVLLVKSPMRQCSVKSNYKLGKIGAPLIPTPVKKPAPYNLYTVGPFAFEPSKKVPCPR